MSLSGKERRPHVENDALSIDANAIDVTLNPRSLTATGRVSEHDAAVEEALGQHAGEPTGPDCSPTRRRSASSPRS